MDKLHQIERNISTSGNYGFVPSGQALYEVVQVKRGRFEKRFNITPGRLVMWKDTTDGTIPTTIVPADLTTAQDLSGLRLGVGYNINKNAKMTTIIREIAPLGIDGCRIESLNAVAPACQRPHISAIYPDCVQCEALSARVRIYDNDTISYKGHPLKAFEERVATYVPDCATCDGCDKTITCDELVCGLVDALNDEAQHFFADGTVYPHTSVKGTGTDLPVEFFKLHPTFNAYCIAPEVGTGCTECNSFAALTTFTVGGNVINFNLTDPADNTKTLVEQLQYAVDKINQAFRDDPNLGRHAGKAVLTRGEGKCCPAQIFVSTCDTTFTIAGLTPCADVIDQFPDFVTEAVCKQCGAADTTTTPNCGIGAIAKLDLEDCDCIDIKQPKQFWGRRVELEIVSPSGAHNTRWSKSATLMEGTVPGNFGSQIQYLEYFANDYEDALGFGDILDHRSGWSGLPDEQSRLKKNVRAKCDLSYCSYELVSEVVNNWGMTDFGTYDHYRVKAGIHVPENDGTTKTAVEDLLKKIQDLQPGGCKTVTGIKCDGTAL